jgi:hypothetical protein
MPALSAQWHHTFNQTYQKLTSHSQQSVIQFQWIHFIDRGRITVIPSTAKYNFHICRHDSWHHGSAVLALSGWSGTYLWVICDTHGTVSVHCAEYSVEWRAFICNIIAKYVSWKQNVAKTFTKNVLLQQCHVKELQFCVLHKSGKVVNWRFSEVHQENTKAWVFSCAKACFTKGLNINSQDNKQWCYKNPVFLYMTCKSEYVVLWGSCSQRNKYQSLWSINADTILHRTNSIRRKPRQSIFFTTL